MDIVLIDDDICLLQIYSLVFEQNGFQTTSFQSGKEAIEHLSKNSPDAIVCDFNLPDTTGIEICSKVHSSNNFRGTFILATGSCLIDEDTFYEAAPVSKVFYKPFNFEDLVNYLKSVERHSFSGCEKAPSLQDQQPSLEQTS